MTFRYKDRRRVPSVPMVHFKSGGFTLRKKNTCAMLVSSNYSSCVNVVDNIESVSVRFLSLPVAKNTLNH